MPIKPIVLQRRHAELGRIRLGHKAISSGGKEYPVKGEKFRFTSPSESYIRDLAELYGGEARPWDNGGKPEFEVFTEARSIEVIAVKGGLSQWLETWSGGGCTHRCDGEVNVLTNEPCNPNDPAHKNAKPTTRLSLMLPELEALGVWRMESHGWNAAAEIPAVAELAQFVGDLVPAVLHLVERRTVKDGKTSRFVVPVLDLRIGTARLKEIVAAKSGTAELEAPATQERPALEAPAAAQPVTEATQQPEVHIPTPQQIADADVATLRRMVAYLDEHGLSDHASASAARNRLAAIDELQQQAAAPQPDADGIVDAELVDEAADGPNADAATDALADQLWQQILAAGGQKGMTLADVEDDFAKRMGGLISADATAAELQHYLGLLKQGAAA